MYIPYSKMPVSLPGSWFFTLNPYQPTLPWHLFGLLPPGTVTHPNATLASTYPQRTPKGPGTQRHNSQGHNTTMPTSVPTAATTTDNLEQPWKGTPDHRHLPQHCSQAVSVNVAWTVERLSVRCRVCRLSSQSSCLPTTFAQVQPLQHLHYCMLH